MTSRSSSISDIAVVVAHHSRLDQAYGLAGRVGAAHVSVDYESRGARWGHLQALRWASARRERVWILEDDALAPADFLDRASEWSARFPDELVSGYLGRQRPPQLQGQIRSKVAVAEARGLDWLTLPTLIHGVCYSIPTGSVGRVVRDLPPGAADYAVGQAWGRPPIYTLPSLVDHADGATVEQHPDGQTRRPGRTAWRPPEGVHHGLGYTG